EVDDPEPGLRANAAQRAAVHGRAAARLGHPLLATAEVAHVPEPDVGDRRAVGERDRDAVERQPPLRVQRPVDRVDDHHPGALARSEGALAELLRHEPEVDPARMQRLELGDRRLLGPVVHHRRVVSAAAAAHDRLAVVASGQVGQRHLDVRGHPPAEVEPLLPHHASSGLNRKPQKSLGKKYVDFWGMTAPAAATARTWSTVGARSRKAADASPWSTSAVAAPSSRTYWIDSVVANWAGSSRPSSGARTTASSTAASTARSGAGVPIIAMPM